MGTENNIKCFCPLCKRETNHEILAKQSMGSGPEDDYWWNSHLYIVKCRGCENLQFLQTDFEESEVEYNQYGDLEPVAKITTFPYKKNLVEPLVSWEIPKVIRTIYKETMECLNNRLFQLAAIGFRAVIEAFCLHENVGGEKLNKMINNLAQKHIISNQDRDYLHAIRFVGNDSAHISKQYKQNELVIIAKIVNSLLTSKYLLAKEVENLDVLPIKTIDEFIKVLDKKILNHQIGSVVLLSNLISKERRIIDEDLPNFEKELIELINNGKYTKLKLAGNPSQGKNKHFEILSH